jgi:hypothetical protein
MNKHSSFLLPALVAFLAAACGRGVTTTNTNPCPTPPPVSAASEAAPAKAPENRLGKFVPPKGFVPNEQTAISIAVAVWSPIYGKEQIESEKPFKASLKDGVWTVTGTLPEGYNGGTAIADISQENGCILRVIHEQ